MMMTKKIVGAKKAKISAVWVGKQETHRRQSFSRGGLINSLPKPPVPHAGEAVGRWAPRG